MKRSVAIHGPTPQFVRWAIVQQCPLRESEDARLPTESFRQLRGLREYSIGLVEGRVFEGICVQQDASQEDVHNVRGFHANEVLDAHGNAASVDACCQSCPANALDLQQPGAWAGCYGWLSATSGQLWRASKAQPAQPHDMNPRSTRQSNPIQFVELFEEIANSCCPITAKGLFQKTTPQWYGFWMDPILDQTQTEFLLEIFNAAVTRCCANGQDGAELIDLVQLRDGLQQCVTHRLKMAVDLVPPGNSDGQVWTIFSHCPDCKYKMVKHGPQPCPACGRFGSPHGQRKSKVLGLRPYVKLAGVLGETPAREFLNRYLSRQ